MEAMSLAAARPVVGGPTRATRGCSSRTCCAASRACPVRCAGSSLLLGARRGAHARGGRAVVRSASEPPESSQTEDAAQGGSPAPAQPPSSPSSPAARDSSGEPGPLELNDVNPISLGRRSRAFVDDVWQRVLSLGTLGRSASGLAEELERVGVETYAPQADGGRTTVLVVGATGRVGTILVRKLSLRGYSVRALVRSVAAADGLPKSVTLIEGDLGDPAAVARAMRGADKVVVCARARSTIASDVNNVEKTGIKNLTKALQDAHNIASMAQDGSSGSRKSKVLLVKFKDMRSMQAAGWLPDSLTSGSGGMELGMGLMRRAGVREAAVDVGTTESGDLRWSGSVQSRGDAQLSGPLQPPDELASCEGLVLRCRGDGKRYACVLRAGDDKTGHWYSASFPTRTSWTPVRLPFADFRPLVPTAPPLDVGAVQRIGFRFDARSQPKKQSAAQPAAAPAAPQRARGRGAFDPDAEFRALSQAQAAAGTAGVSDDGSNAFLLEVGIIKALPGGGEPDFILVSCAGAGLDAEEADKVVPAKRAGEALLRNSGLGYTILRPGALFEAPGGAKALLFDQGGRITEKITCADVADVCLKALHDVEARNKSFDVCHEYAAADGGRYELVAHLPEKNNSYLTPAMRTLEKNT